MLASKDFSDKLISATECINSALLNEKRIYIFGNGGSAADAQHIAAEFIGRFKAERKALPVEALSVNTSVLTALGNDYDFSVIFSRQLEAFGSSGDACIGLSTSGNSSNVLLGLKTAKEIGMKTIGITGSPGGKMKNMVDICLCMPSNDTPRIQELTIFTAHVICELVESSDVTER